jgi:hypothetical protein
LRAWAHLTAGVLAVGVLVAGVCTWYASASHQNARPPSDTQADRAGLFQPDPQGISNRLYREIHVRTAKNGKEYGFDELDPLLWSQTKYLLSGPSHARVLHLLDEYSRAPAEQQLRDPVKKAILARELWAVFDWATPQPGQEYNWRQDRSRRELTSRLVPVIRRLALNPDEIAALPDTYQRAIQNKEFPAEFDSAQPDHPFLPPDLFNPHGPWVCIGIPGKDPIAPSHEQTFSRSVFLVFMRLPGGREAAVAYLKQLAEPHSSQKLPAGAEFALVRRMMLPNDWGSLVVTPVIESIQIRHYRETAPDDSPMNSSDHEFARRSQSVFEFKWDRAALFSGEHSGLRSVNSTDPGFILFMSMGFDPFEDLQSVEKYPPALSFCTKCHSGLGVQSVLSFTKRWNPASIQPAKPGLAETSPAAEAHKVIGRKQTQDDWRLFLQLWDAGSAQSAK